MFRKGGCYMDDYERIILDVNGKEIEMLHTIRTHFKEKHGVELSNGALLRDLMDIEYIRITKDRHKYD
ncbi:ProA domain protein [Bacillus cereus]|uniref:ProA domain protein n=2 Tax=Bacillus cereus group TaxID=86661 RepID=A0A2B2NC55_BACCE|nr:ProA domain protein [Bacillus cereus]PEA18554.1 ProA domain protein [Bacillus cereus]PEA26430.1 ProA domain protein [Bacillus cereus]PEB81538.1 ProA domain protein [Bacillus cereus]PEE19576.1 ProA domain protein [Bacillus cereus]